MIARRRRSLPALAAATGLALVLGAVAAQPGADQAQAAKPKRPVHILVFSKTAGFRHYSIPIGRDAIEDLGAEHGFGTDASENPAVFNRKGLRRYDAVVFLNTTGDILGPGQQKVLNRYIRRGGGYAGIHSAADTEHGWPFYRKLVGAHFQSHPIQQTAWFENEGGDGHPATEHLDSRFLTADEFYSFKQNPRKRVRVLLTIDEETYSPDPNTTQLPGGTPASGVMGDHPMSWCHENLGRGRTFYTALGHEGYLYAVDWYRRHILGGILYAAGVLDADCSPRR